MTPERLAELTYWFRRHAFGYFNNDPAHDQAISMKAAHTGRVVKNILTIGRASGLSDEDLRIAEAIALFHDLGRFRQYEEWGRFQDSVTVNHALLSIREFSTRRLLWDLPATVRRLIVRAIAAHNRPRIPDDAKERERFFMNLIRDADKLDIWCVYADHYAAGDRESLPVLDNGLPAEDHVSPEVLHCLQKRKPIRYETLRSLHDLRLLQMAWVWDLNLPASFQLLHRQGCFYSIQRWLPDTAEIREIISAINAHILARCAAAGESSGHLSPDDVC